MGGCPSRIPGGNPPTRRATPRAGTVGRFNRAGGGGVGRIPPNPSQIHPKPVWGGWRGGLGRIHPPNASRIRPKAVWGGTAVRGRCGLPEPVWGGWGGGLGRMLCLAGPIRSLQWPNHPRRSAAGLPRLRPQPKPVRPGRRSPRRRPRHPPQPPARPATLLCKPAAAARTRHPRSRPHRRAPQPCLCGTSLPRSDHDAPQRGGN